MDSQPSNRSVTIFCPISVLHTLFSRNHRYQKIHLSDRCRVSFPIIDISIVFLCTILAAKVVNVRESLSILRERLETRSVVSRSKDDLVLGGTRQGLSIRAFKATAPHGRRFFAWTARIFSAEGHILDAPRSANDRDETKLYSRVDILERAHRSVVRGLVKTLGENRSRKRFCSSRPVKCPLLVKNNIQALAHFCTVRCA